MSDSNARMVQSLEMPQRVHIKLERVQTWLFAVPRLRAMVGSNTLIGEILRIKLPELARSSDKWALVPLVGAYPTAYPNDPLQGEDDPSVDAADGILARDGGHFEAQFAHGAKEFATAAIELLHRELPGLRFRMWVDKTEYQKAHTYLSTELPVLAPCQWTGRGLAATVIQGDKHANVSLDAARRYNAANDKEYKAKDLASLLSATSKLGTFQQAQDLHDLVNNGYLALIHADGNNVGSSAGSPDEQLTRFFHRNRVLLRRALQKAIESACEGETGIEPLVILMLGGDDLLVICRAAKALPFVVSLCGELEVLQRESTVEFKLTLGVGVVIAQPKVPIYRLHDVAERLASSAKRRFRGLKERDGMTRSVVDWAVYTTAWVDDPEEVRRRDWICGTDQDRRVLSQRPLDVLGRGLTSLEGLIERAETLKGAPRSQLRYLVEQLPRGRHLAELAFAELSQEAKTALRDVGVNSVWQKDGNSLTTPLLDLIEMTEIARLGRINKPTQPKQEVVNG